MGGYLTGRKVTENNSDNYCLNENQGALYELKKDRNDLNEIIEFKYIEKKQISEDTFIFTYEVPKKMKLGLNLGQHIAIDALINGENVSRKYTPISTIFDEGLFKLLIKVYFKGVHPIFPKGGLMSQHLHELELEKTIKVRGPFGKLTYLGNGKFKFLTKYKPLTYQEKTFKNVVMLAGGTGITPFYQILQAAHLNSDCSTFTMLFGNKTTKDILMKMELDEFVKTKKFNFDLNYLIDKEEDNWNGLVGYINQEMISKVFPSPSEDTILLLCGPPIMCKKAKEILAELNYSVDNIFEF